tara:strand:- start:2323 stop:3000 length:678 start_codon:yes stop_codon:yes gene_type:complete
MKGNKLIEFLKAQLFVGSDSELASSLGITQSRVSQLRYDENVGDKTVNSLIKKSLAAKSESLAANAIKPIVEFFETELCEDSERSFLDTSKADRQELKKVLQKARGIYSFYNSELEIIYVGKTKNDLWTEMCNAYNRNMNHYKRYYVAHPYEKYTAPQGGKVRRIKLEEMGLWHAASYFSAYSVDETLIDAFEQLMIRMIPNDLLNVRMEGNSSLVPFVGKIPGV